MLATETETSILKRVICPEIGDMPPEVAKTLVSFGFSESDHFRMAELSNRAQEGLLTTTEQDELDGYINVSHFIAFVRSKARLSLKLGHNNTSAA